MESNLRGLWQQSDECIRAAFPDKSLSADDIMEYRHECWARAHGFTPPSPVDRDNPSVGISFELTIGD